MQECIIEKGCIDKLPILLARENAKNVIVFRGKKSYPEEINIYLKEYKVSYCENIAPNPKIDDIKKSIDDYDVVNFDVIITVGGGSVIDFAKAYKYYSNSTIPLIAIPTTAGTGSESTQFAVVYVDGIKTSIDTESILPEYVLYDSNFLASGSKYLKACTALDAFAQALESYWAVGSTIESKEYAKEAIILLKDAIIPFVLSNDDVVNRTMAKAANLAGKAINISRTTAAHALSYAFTSQYNIPHGHAVALSLADVFESNLRVTNENCVDSRGVDYVKDTMKQLSAVLEISPSEFRLFLQNILDSIEIGYDLQKLHITTTESIISSVNLERLKNNPVNIVNSLSNFWKR